LNPKVQTIRAGADSAEIARRVEIVDRYGEIQRRLALLEPDRKEAKELEKQISAWHADDPADVRITERGHLYEIHLSPKRNQRVITDKKRAWSILRKLLGLDALLAALDVPLALLDKHVPKEEQEMFVVQERTGYRTFEVVARNQAA
jgi:hypothetical protein